MFPENLADLGCLQGELAGGHEEQGLDLWLIDVDLLERGDHKGCGFAGTVFRACKDVALCESDGDGFFLDR